MSQHSTQTHLTSQQVATVHLQLIHLVGCHNTAPNLTSPPGAAGSIWMIHAVLYWARKSCASCAMRAIMNARLRGCTLERLFADQRLFVSFLYVGGLCSGHLPECRLQVATRTVLHHPTTVKELIASRQIQADHAAQRWINNCVETSLDLRLYLLSYQGDLGVPHSK